MLNSVPTASGHRPAMRRIPSRRTDASDARPIGRGTSAGAGDLRADAAAQASVAAARWSMNTERRGRRRSHRPRSRRPHSDHRCSSRRGSAGPGGTPIETLPSRQAMLARLVPLRVMLSCRLRPFGMPLSVGRPKHHDRWQEICHARMDRFMGANAVESPRLALFCLTTASTYRYIAGKIRKFLQ
jgi:hypothetical protein